MEGRCYSPFQKIDELSRAAFDGTLSQEHFVDFKTPKALFNRLTKKHVCCYSWGPLHFSIIGASTKSFKLLISTILQTQPPESAEVLTQIMQGKIDLRNSHRDVKNEFPTFMDLAAYTNLIEEECSMTWDPSIQIPGATHPDRILMRRLLEKGYWKEAAPWEIQRLMWLGHQEPTCLMSNLPRETVLILIQLCSVEFVFDETKLSLPNNREILEGSEETNPITK